MVGDVKRREKGCRRVFAEGVMVGWLWVAKRFSRRASRGCLDEASTRGLSGAIARVSSRGSCREGGCAKRGYVFERMSLRGGEEARGSVKDGRGAMVASGRPF